MLNLVRHNNSSRKIIQDGYVLLLISHESELKIEDLSLLDGFVLDTDSTAFAYEIVKNLRTHSNFQVALKPIFVSIAYKLPEYITTHTDGCIELSLVSSYIQRIATINKRISSIEEPKLVSHEVVLQHRLLSYLFSRNTQLNPIHTRESLIGYEFPFFSLYYKKTEGVNLLGLLRKITDQNYMSFKLKDYIHLCKSCSGNYLNFRECCPKCNSIDIEAHDMIHHFECAHVAPEKDFKKEHGLECPKCDKSLRHIGIDYDKPSTIYSCNSCSHEFQNPGMLSMCMDCGTENQLEELLQKSIGTYALTQKGEQLLFQKGKSYAAREMQHSESLGSMSVPLFKILLEQEIKRVKATRGNSFFASIRFKNNQLQLLNADAKKGLMQEISEIIKSYLKDTDILSAESFNSYYVLLPETNESQLERLENIDYNLAKLLSDNIKEEQQQIEITIHKVRGEDLLQNYFS